MNDFNKLVKAQDEYIALLVKEIESMVSIAYTHGWRSDNHEAGALLREKIAALKHETAKAEQEGRRWVNCSERMPNGFYVKFKFRMVEDKRSISIKDIRPKELHLYEWYDETPPVKEIEQELRPIKPLGDWLLAQKDLPPVMLPDGGYWYYGSVLQLLKRYLNEHEAATPPVREVTHTDDVETTWNTFWKEIVCSPDGMVNLEQVKKELHDFHYVMGEVPKVYCHVTGDRLSKIMYPAETVISVADEYMQEIVDREMKDRNEDQEINEQSIEAAPVKEAAPHYKKTIEQLQPRERKFFDFLKYITNDEELALGYCGAFEEAAKEAGQAVEEELEERIAQTVYLYYQVEYKNCSFEEDYTICETLEDVIDSLKIADTDLDDEEAGASVIITGVGLTPIQFEEWRKGTLDLPTESRQKTAGESAFVEWIREQNYKPYAGWWYLNGNNFANQPVSSQGLYDLWQQSQNNKP